MCQNGSGLSHILVQIPADADEAAEKEAREKIEKPASR